MALKEPIFHMEEQFGHQQQPVRMLFQAARKDPAERGSGQLSLMLDHSATFVPIWSILRQFNLLWIKMWVRDLNKGWVCLCKCVACVLSSYCLSAVHPPFYTLLYAFGTLQTTFLLCQLVPLQALPVWGAGWGGCRAGAGRGACFFLFASCFWQPHLSSGTWPDGVSWFQAPAFFFSFFFFFDTLRTSLIVPLRSTSPGSATSSDVYPSSARPL